VKKLLVGTALLLIATSAHAQIATIYPPPAQNDHSCWADALRAYPDSDHSQDRREYAAACEENEVRRNNLLDEARRKYALDCARPDESSLTRHDCYINRDGTSVHSPSRTTEPNQAPVGSTATCADGTSSYSQHHSGTCSHHGGVAQWRK